MSGFAKRIQRNGSVGLIKQSVNSSAAGIHASGHFALTNRNPLAKFLNLNSKNSLHGDELDFSENPFVFQEIAKTTASMFSFTHCFSDIDVVFFRARSSSPLGVFWLFLMNLCSRTISSSTTMNNVRAIRSLNRERISQRPSPRKSTSQPKVCRAATRTAQSKYQCRWLSFLVSADSAAIRVLVPCPLRCKRTRRPTAYLLSFPKQCIKFDTPVNPNFRRWPFTVAGADKILRLFRARYRCS